MLFRSLIAVEAGGNGVGRGDIEDDEAAGNVSVDVGFMPMELDWEGGFESEDDLVGTFGGDLMMFAMEGRIEAHRVSLYVDP